MPYKLKKVGTKYVVENTKASRTDYEGQGGETAEAVRVSDEEAREIIFLCVGVARCSAMLLGEFRRSSAPHSHLKLSYAGFLDMYGSLRNPLPGIIYCLLN